MLKGRRKAPDERERDWKITTKRMNWTENDDRGRVVDHVLERDVFEKSVVTPEGLVRESGTQGCIAHFVVGHGPRAMIRSGCHGGAQSRRFGGRSCKEFT